MTIVLFILLYGIVGTIVGRVLFRKRLSNKSRYVLERQTNSWGEKTGPLRAIDTDDMTSAQTYGLWSVPLWPLTISLYLIQAPTPEEKQQIQKEKAQEIMREFKLPSLTSD